MQADFNKDLVQAYYREHFEADPDAAPHDGKAFGCKTHQKTFYLDNGFDPDQTLDPDEAFDAVMWKCQSNYFLPLASQATAAATSTRGIFAK